MHYKNGTEAKEGDAIIMKRWTGRVAAGVLHTVSGTSTSCNGQVAVPIPGGVQHECVTIGELYSAEDAWTALLAAQNQKSVSGEPAPAASATA